MRRLMMMGAGACAMVVLLATPAFAHECYNASRSDKGNQQIAAHSPSYNTFDETVLGFATSPDGLGLCPAGGQYLLDQIHAAAAQPGSGIDLNWVVSNRTVQAGGLENTSNPSAQQNLSNGTGIDHLGENPAIGAVIGANIDAAAALCGP
jgi:hypothetical protein